METLGLPDGLLLGMTRNLLLAFAAFAIVFAVCVRSDYVPAMLWFCCLVVVLVLTRFKLQNLAVAYILADHLSQFFKRAIYLLGPQTTATYYGFQTMPAIIMVLAFLFSLPTILKVRLPLSVKFLMAYICLAVGTTLLTPGGSNLSSRVAGIYGSVAPLSAIFVGIALQFRILKTMNQVLLALVVLSVPYGLFQFFNGPTRMDREWASATYRFSIEGAKVFENMRHGLIDFRSYSYYADHATWGIFLAFSMLAILAGRSTGASKSNWVWVAIPLGLAGMVTAATRSVWIGFLGALALHRLISVRTLRRPALVIASIFLGFGLVLWGGNYALDNIHLQLTSNSLLNRYLTVGTINARVSAPDIFVELLPTNWLVGRGYGGSALLRGFNGREQDVTRVEYSHNLIVDTLLYVGLPGVILLCSFLLIWIQEAFEALRMSSTEMSKTIRWCIAIVVGELLIAPLNGGLFINFYCCLIFGMVTGELIRLRAERQRMVDALIVAERQLAPRLSKAMAEAR